MKRTKKQNAKEKQMFTESTEKLISMGWKEAKGIQVVAAPEIKAFFKPWTETDKLKAANKRLKIALAKAEYEKERDERDKEIKEITSLLGKFIPLAYVNDISFESLINKLINKHIIAAFEVQKINKKINDINNE